MFKKYQVLMLCLLLSLVAAEVCVLPGCDATPKAEGTSESGQEGSSEISSDGAQEATQEPTTEPDAEPATEPPTEPAQEPVTEPTTEPATEPVTEPTQEASPDEGSPEPTSEPAVDGGESTGDGGTSEPTGDGGTSEPTPDGGEMTPDGGEVAGDATPEGEPIPEKASTFNVNGQVRRFLLAGKPGYAEVKVCVHDKLADVATLTPMAGFNCTLTNTSGNYTMNGLPLNKEFYISLSSNGPNSKSSDILPTMIPVISTPMDTLTSIRTDIITKTEAGQISAALMVSLDLTKNGVLVADVFNVSTASVAGVTMSLFPGPLPTGASGPIYMPATFPGVPSQTGTTSAGIAVYTNLPPGSYTVGFKKTGVMACRAHPTTPSVTSPCHTGAVSGQNDCAKAPILKGWMTITSSTCP